MANAIKPDACINLCHLLQDEFWLGIADMHRSAKKKTSGQRKSDKTLNMHAELRIYFASPFVCARIRMLLCLHREWWFVGHFFLQHLHQIFHVHFRLCECRSACKPTVCARVATTIDRYKFKMSHVFPTQIATRVDNAPWHIQFKRRAHSIHRLHTTLMAISTVKYYVHLFHFIVNI